MYTHFKLKWPNRRFTCEALKEAEQMQDMADTRIAFLKEAFTVLKTPEVDDEDTRPGMKEIAALGR